MDNYESDPEYWRRRAEEAREQAKKISDPELVFLMKSVALGYELIAEKIEKKVRH